jgi:16S rRNA (uracil1498-N3)-methyltransferase
MPRFYVDPGAIQGDFVFLDEKESHHARSVLRLKEGEGVQILDGKGRSFDGIIRDFENGRLKVELRQTGKKPAKALLQGPEVTLGVSVVKPERMDFLVQKASELGVAAIAPLISQRCVIKLSKERWEGKLKRWRKIALESCKQCGQSRIPEIGSVEIYRDFVQKKASAYEKILIPTLALRGGILYSSLKAPKPRTLLALLGPEGDFTQEEVRLAVSCGALPVSLGPLVLRTETAAIYLLSVIQFFYREAIHETTE